MEWSVASMIFATVAIVAALASMRVRYKGGKSEFRIGPAWDKREEEREKSRGLQGVTLVFHVEGIKVTAKWVVETNWHNEKATQQFIEIGNLAMITPKAHDVKLVSESGEFSLNGTAELMWEKLLSSGSEGVTEELRRLTEEAS